MSAKLPKLSSLAFTCLSLLWSAPSEAQQQPPSANAPTVNVTVPPDTTLGQPADGSAGESATELAKKLQNPIGHLYNVPFQNNTNFNVGPHSGTQDILNIQPAIPIHVNQDWNVITRTILPLVWSPSFQPGQSFPFGTGPMTFSAFLSPRNPVDGWFSFGGTQGPNGTRYGLFTINPFLNYDFGDEGRVAAEHPRQNTSIEGRAIAIPPVDLEQNRKIAVGEGSRYVDQERADRKIAIIVLADDKPGPSAQQ